MKQVWQANDGKTFYSEQECKDYEKKSYENLNYKKFEELKKKSNQNLLRKKWIEQNDIEKLFGKENQLWFLGEKKNKLAEDCMGDKQIFRSADNQYFNNLKEYKMYQKKLRNGELPKIIDKERIWRSKIQNYYFSTEEECLLFERTSKYNGKIFDTFQERVEYDHIIFSIFMEGENLSNPEDKKLFKLNQQLHNIVIENFQNLLKIQKEKELKKKLEIKLLAEKSEYEKNTGGIIYTSIAFSVLVVGLLWIPIQDFIENRDLNSYSFLYQEYIENK